MKKQQKKCLVCGKNFYTSLSFQKYCSKKCSSEFNKYKRPSYKEWWSLMEYCMERDNFECKECGSDENLVVHHIIFLTNGGTNKPENLETLCSKCHAKKHSL